MLRLTTLGRLALEGSDFSEQKPLLLLCCLALGGVTVRHEIAERFWGGPDKSPDMSKKSLETALGSLRGVDPRLIVSPGRGEISSEVATDVHDLYAALAEADYPRVAELYRGPFLNGVERNNKVRLPGSGELEEWIINKREELRSLVQEAMLRHAEVTAREERFEDAAELTWSAFRLDGAVTYPTLEDYRRIHTLLLAGGRTKEAESVRAEALEFSIEDELHLCDTPQEARRRLTSLATLPAPAEIFLGRKVEIERALERIRMPGVQLVTLVGPPGVGKTELASAVAHEARRRGHFARGLAFVSFDGIPDGTPDAALLDRMAAGLNLWLSGGAPEPRDLAHAIGDRETLLVLDNFEELAPRAALLADLVERCPALTLLVTSRVVLAVEREHLVHTDALAVPPEQADDPAGYPSVQVFLAAARQRGSEPAAAELPHVARIARLVGGLPLALHLAAGWSRELAPADIADRLETSLELLDGELRDVPERQRSLRSALDGSWKLLSGSERSLFRRLAVFREGFTLAAAEAVAGARLVELHSLNGRSLLRFDALEKRHHLHPLIRRYAAERLEAASEAGAIRDAHARHYLEALQLMVDPDPKVRDAGPRRLRPDIANLVDAWRHAVGRGWREAVEVSAYPLERLLDLSGRYHLGVRLLEAGGEVDGASDAGSLQASLDASRAWLLMRQGRDQEALDLAEPVLARLRASGSVAGFRGLRKALVCLGAACDSLGRFPEAQTYLEEAVAIEPSEDSHKAAALLNLGHINNKRGDLERAEQLYRQADRIFRSHDRRAGMITSGEALGELYLRLGKVSRAEAAALRSLGMARELVLPHWEMQLYCLLGDIRLAQGQLDDAALYGAKAMEIARAVDNRSLTLRVCCLYGEIAAQRGSDEAMWRSFREAWVLADNIGKPRQIRVLQQLLGALAIVTEEAGVAAVAGYLSTVENEAWLASDLREAIRSLLEKYERLFSAWPEAWAEGRAASLDQLVEDHLPQLLV